MALQLYYSLSQIPYGSQQERTTRVWLPLVCYYAASSKCADLLGSFKMQSRSNQGPQLDIDGVSLWDRVMTQSSLK